MTKRINKILWNGTEVPKASTQADGLDGLNLGELFIKNDPQEPGVYTRTTDGEVVSLGSADWNKIKNKPTKVSYFTNDANYATTSDLDTRIDALVNGAPAAYDTLKEIADVLAGNVDSIADILDALGTKVSKTDFNTAIANVNTAIDSLNTELGLKLDAVTFNELFEKVQLEDGTWAIKAKLGLFSDGFISAKGSNVGGTSSEGGAVALYQLNDVLSDGTGVSGATDGAVFVYDGKLGKWKGIAQSEIVPNLTGYATESWVLQQGFLTQHQDLSDYAKLSDIPVIPTTDINKGVTAYGWGDHSKVGYLTGITSKLVTDALGYTPYDAANFTKAAIKSTLGISDWALASSKPSYTTKEVAEDTNLYFTNARAVAALKSVTDGLQSDIDTKLDASVFSELFEKVTLEDGVTAIRAKYGLFTDYFLSAKGANSSGGSSSGGGLITSLYRYADLGKTFADTNNDTFNAYTINKINSDLGSRISVLEGKATNVSFTQSLTSGTQIGSISIDGVTKNIYAPTIPTSDINKGVTAYGWGDHRQAGYLTSASSLVWGKITGTPTTISGYGITDALTVLTSSADTNLSITIGGTTKSIANLYARYTERFRVVWNNPSEGTYDLNDLLGGYVRAYGSGGTLVNAPESFGHGAILSLTNGTKALSGQLAWNIKHGNTSDVTKNLFWRVGDSANGYTYAKWHQIAFTDYVDTKLEDYLPLSGGTISSANGGALVIDRTSGGESYIKLLSGGVYKGAITVGNSEYGASIYNASCGKYLGIKDDGTPHYHGSALIHSGNIGSQSVSYATSAGDADTLDGMQGSLYKRLKGAENLGASADNLVDLNATTGFNTYSSTNSASAYISNKPYTNNRGFQMEVMCQLGSIANYVRQMLYEYGSNNIYTRYSSDSGTNWGDWKQFAYLTSNVASATKLQTARTIWGQSFDGTGDVTGDISLGSGVIRSNYGHTMLSSNGYILIGYETAANGYRTYIDGNDIYLRYGQSHTNGLILSNGGNVLIGTTTDSGYKLDVNGSGYFNSYIAIANNNGIYFKDTSGTIRSQLYVDPNNNTSIGYGAIQTSGNTALYGTYIRFLTSSSDERMRITNNGYVGIGTTSPSYMLDVNGTLNVTGQATLSSVVDMGNAVRMVNSKYIYGRTTENVLHNILGINGSNILLVNYGAVDRNVKAWLYGNEFRFNLYTDGATNGTLAWTDSKLGVGTSAPEYKADIRGTIGVSDAITLRGTTATTANLAFSRSGYNYITFPSDGSLCLSTTTSTSGIVLRVTSSAVEPMTTATKSVGTSSKRWGAIYGVDGDFSGTLHATTGIWSDGYVSAKGQNTSSDMRLKNILNDVVLNVSDIANAPSIRFAWKNGGGIDVGSIAQYWQPLLPDAVKERDGRLEMQYANIALLSAIAIAKRVETHEERIETHEERIARLEKENKELRSEIMILKGGSYA